MIILKRNCTNLLDLTNTIKNLFEEEMNTLIVNKQTTKELYNVQYVIDKRFIKQSDGIVVLPNSEEDAVERNQFFARITNFCANQLFDDILSRQCVIQQKYAEIDLASCISFVQLIIRKNVIDLHVVVRSQNFDSNFEYDNLTYCKLMFIANRILKISIGKIFIKVVSLHKIL